MKFLAPDGGGGDGGGEATEGEGDKPKNLQEFNERFSARAIAPTLTGDKPTEDQIKQATTQVEEPKEGEKKVEKKTGAFVPRLVEEKRAAEQKAQEAQARAEKYEKEEKPALETKIQELQSKIDSGELSPLREREYQQRVETLENTLNERETSLVNENKALKDRLSYHSVSESEEFQEEYVAPAVASHKAAVQIITGDQPKLQALHRALIANSASLNAKNEGDYNQAVSERDDLLSSITDGMNTFAAQRFTTAMGLYIQQTERHAKALGDHQNTGEALRKQNEQRRDTERNKILSNWGTQFTRTAEDFKDDEVFTDDVAKKAKELGLDVDRELKESAVIAQKTIAGRASMNESVELVHRGRVYPALKAQIKTQSAIIKDLNATISKLRGAGTGNGEGTGASSATKSDKPTREEFNNRFSPNRSR